MNKTQLIIAIGLALQTSTGFGAGYTFAQGTGQLSYTYFNLNQNTVTITPYATGANSYGQTGSTSVSTGWDNTAGNYGGSTVLSMFNDGLQTQTDSKYCNKSEYYINSPIFFASNFDPVTPPSSASYTVSSGGSQSVVEISGKSYELVNPPAMADSWVVTLDSSDNILIANMASTSNLLFSGSQYSYGNWPFCYSYNGEWYNANLNPSDPNNSAATSYTPPGATSAISQWTNPLGAGFVPAGQTMNLNVSPTDPNYSPTGGLWSGVNVNNSSNLATNSVNYSMYPINLSSYVIPNTGELTVPGSGSINGTSYNYYNVYYTSIYGGHFTLAIGDPYVISSFAAKMLWTLVSSPSYSFNGNSLSTSNISGGANSISSIASGAFYANSTPANYATWLLGAPQLAQQAFTNAVNANSPPITSTHESLWGKVVNGILKVGVDAGLAFAAAETGGASVAVQMSVAGASDATGAYGSDVTDAIANAATTTTTLSPPPPQSQTAPPIVNNTYASSNLLGLWMANSFVQAEINAANGNTGTPSMVLWTNASINVDGLCEVTTATSGANTVSVDNNLLSGSCYTTNSSGTLNNGENGTTVATASNNSSQSAQTYTNPLSLYANAQSSSQINLWGPILTGSDITAGSSGAANGYMQLGNPTLPAFSPPTQMVTAGGFSSAITGVNTTFNQNTGMLTVASYTSSGTTTLTKTPPSPIYPYMTLTLQPPGNPTGTSGTNTLEAVIGGLTWGGNGCTVVYPGNYCYNFNTGVVTVAGYSVAIYSNGIFQQTNNPSFSNGTQTLDMTTCAIGSSFVITVNTTNIDLTTGAGASGSLSCSTPTAAVALGSNPVPTSWPTLNMTVSTPSTAAFFSPVPTSIYPPLTGTYYYDTSTGGLLVSGYFSQNGLSPSNQAYSQIFSNGVQSINLTTCANNVVNLTLTPSTTITPTTPPTYGSGASGTLSCGTPWPPSITVVNATTAAANNTIQPANVTVSGTTITVGGFTVGSSTTVTPFTPINSAQTSVSLDTSTCNQSIIRSTLAYNSSNSSYNTQFTTTPLNVTLTVYPIGSNNTSVMGVLSCQSPPTLSYNACTSDPYASGGVIAALTGPALSNPQGPMFELACTCVPSYLGGPNPVVSSSTQTQSNFTSNNFIATGGTDSNGNPNGVVVGATSTYPAQQCPQNW